MTIKSKARRKLFLNTCSLKPELQCFKTNEAEEDAFRDLPLLGEGVPMAPMTEHESKAEARKQLLTSLYMKSPEAVGGAVCRDAQRVDSQRQRLDALYFLSRCTE